MSSDMSISNNFYRTVSSTLLSEGLLSNTRELGKKQKSIEHDDNLPSKISKSDEDKNPLILSYDELKVSGEPIVDGYGEYLIYRIEGQSVSEELYNAAFEIIHQQQAVDENYNRTASIREQLKELDPCLEIIFVPRTLYELIYIREAINEEISANGVCPLQDLETYRSIKSSEKETFLQKHPHCYHICHFTDSSPEDEDKELIRTLAFRINSVALQKLPSQRFLKGEEVSQCLEEGLTFLREHHRSFDWEFYAEYYSEGKSDSCGVTINFGVDDDDNEEGSLCWPMSIREDIHAQTVRNAVAVECSKIARNAQIVYRGGSIRAHNPSSTSLSYGTSLFAGAFLDGSATVFYYATSEDRPTYAIVVPNHDENPPFYIPDSHPIRQLLSKGEYFHARSLLSKSGLRRSFIKGIVSTAPPPEYLYSKDDKATLTVKLVYYHSKAILLSDHLQDHRNPLALNM